MEDVFDLSLPRLLLSLAGRSFSEARSPRLEGVLSTETHGKAMARCIGRPRDGDFGHWGE
jgi:hypothetical protein